MDKAPAYGAGDSRFDPWQGRKNFSLLILNNFWFADTNTYSSTQVSERSFVFVALNTKNQYVPRDYKKTL